MTQVKIFYGNAVDIENERAKSGFVLDAIASSGDSQTIKKVADSFQEDTKRKNLEDIKEKLKQRKPF